MIEFSLFKIPVRVELSFWIVIGILGFLVNQQDPSALLLNAGLFVVAAFVSVLIHELGHALMVRLYGFPTMIVLSSFGGYATHPHGVLTRRQSFLVALAGPLLQAFVGVAILYMLNEFGPLPANKVRYLVSVFINVSLFWAVISCIPVLPLDGGRMVEAILGPKKIKTTLLISMITAGALAVLSFNYASPLLAMFMLIYGWQNYQTYKQL